MCGNFGKSGRFNRLAHTYSIVAVDQERGEMGAAVQSHWFSVGTSVIWAEPGVGVVATQAMVNISYGPNGLALLRRGLLPQEVLERLTAADEARHMRQLAILSPEGEVAAWTGSGCIAEAGHLTGDGFSVQANMMLRDTVWSAMAETFVSTEGPLAERMLAALDAAEKEGGDIRGRQSAALVVVRTGSTGRVWEDRIIDLRVDDSHQPLEELRRLLSVKRAYEHMDQGDLEMERGDMAKALYHYSSAEEMVPDNEEMMFWHAVTLVNNGHLDDAAHLFNMVFAKNDNWRELLRRLFPAGLLKVTKEQLEGLVKVKDAHCTLK